MTAPSTSERWRQAVDATVARRQAKREARAELDRRRSCGLAYRTAQRLRRARGGESSTTNREESSS